MKINRKELVEKLETVLSGLASTENIIQSSCFVFKGGRVFTYNEEIFCSMPCDIGVDGAIPSSPLLTLLSKMKEESVEISSKKKRLLIKGENKASGIRYETKIELPIDQVLVPKKWQPVGEDFIRALDLAYHCCSTSDLHDGLRCVHITQKFVESCDNVQACRVSGRFPLSSEAFVRQEAAMYVSDLKPSKFAEDSNWLHFKLDNGCVISCRRWEFKYPDLKKLFEFKGSTIKIPSGLSEAAQRATIFSGEDTSVVSQEVVNISLKKGKITVSGRGESGWYRETNKVKYSGPDLDFAIVPDILKKIAKDHTTASIGDGRLAIDGDSWRLIFCLITSTKV